MGELPCPIGRTLPYRTGIVRSLPLGLILSGEFTQPLPPICVNTDLGATLHQYHQPLRVVQSHDC